MRIETRAIEAGDRDWAAALVAQHFGSHRVVSRGALHDTRSLPGLVAERGGERVGLLLHHVQADACEIVVLIASERRRGVGRALLDALASVADERGFRRVWLVTTNANAPALAFYPAVGWERVATHRGTVCAARRLKPEIPERNAEGVPIEDEIEFELRRAAPDGAGREG